MEPNEVNSTDAELKELRDPERWTGGDYELGLAMPLGSLDISTRHQLLQALWGDPLLTGVVRDKRELESRGACGCRGSW